MKNTRFNFGRTLWVITGLLVIFISGMLIPWGKFNTTKDNQRLKTALENLEKQKSQDSIRIMKLNEDLQGLSKENLQLKDLVTKSQARLDKLKTERIERQYEIFQYSAHAAGRYFLDHTGAGNHVPEMLPNNGDTCMITPMSCITEANVKFVELEYTLKEKEDYVSMTYNLQEQIVNYQDMLSIKDSVIIIKDGQLLLSDQAIEELKKANARANKKRKSERIKLYVAGGAAAVLGLIAILK